MLYSVIFFILVLLFFLPTILIFFKVNVVIEYLRNSSNDHFILTFYTLNGLIKFKYEIPLIDVDKEGIKFKKYKEQGKKEKGLLEDNVKSSFSSLVERYKSIRCYYAENREFICKIKDYLSGKLVLKKIDFRVEAGIGDAFYTGVFTGLLWILVGVITSYILTNVKTLEKHVEVQSDFNKARFDVDLYCIFGIRIVHIIVVRLRVYLHNKRTNKSKKINKSIGGGISG